MHSPRGSGWNSTREQDWSGVRGKWDGVQEVVNGTLLGVGDVYLRHLRHWGTWGTFRWWCEAPRRHSQCLKLKAGSKEFTTLILYFGFERYVVGLSYNSRVGRVDVWHAPGLKPAHAQKWEMAGLRRLTASEQLFGILNSNFDIFLLKSRLFRRNYTF